jgi:hypothetical protein
VVKERLERRRALVEDAIARISKYSYLLHDQQHRCCSVQPFSFITAGKGETVTTVLHRDEEVELNNCIKEALVRSMYFVGRICLAASLNSSGVSIHASFQAHTLKICWNADVTLHAGYSAFGKLMWNVAGLCVPNSHFLLRLHLWASHVIMAHMSVSTYTSLFSLQLHMQMDWSSY